MASKFLNLDLDNTLGGNNPSDYKIPSQKATKNYIDSKTILATILSDIDGNVVLSPNSINVAQDSNDDIVVNAAIPTSVDSELNLISENPVQNKVITSALNNNLNTKADINLSNITTAGKQAVSNIAMPSATYDVVGGDGSGITFTTGTKLTAPADGWYFLNFSSQNGGGYSKLDWADGVWQAKNVSEANHNMSWIIPVRKTIEITVTFSANIRLSMGRFYYC